MISGSRFTEVHNDYAKALSRTDFAGIELCETWHMSLGLSQRQQLILAALKQRILYSRENIRRARRETDHRRKDAEEAGNLHARFMDWSFKDLLVR